MRTRNLLVLFIASQRSLLLLPQSHILWVLKVSIYYTTHHIWETTILKTDLEAAATHFARVHQEIETEGRDQLRFTRQNVPSVVIAAKYRLDQQANDQFTVVDVLKNKMDVKMEDLIKDFRTIMEMIVGQIDRLRAALLQIQVPNNLCKALIL